MSSQRVLEKIGSSIFGVLSVLLFLVTTALAGTTLEPVDSTGMVGQYTSLAVDVSANVHISYYDGSNGDLKYATNSSGSWLVETLDTAGDVGQYTSLAIDPSGKIHISYCDATNFDLKYATNAGGSWLTTTLDNTGSVGMYTSLAIGSNGKVHISYYDITNTNLKYATNSSGSWLITTLDSSGSTGSYTSLTVDSSNKVHISYFDSTLACLKYATNASGTWSTEIVANSGGSAGQYTSLAVDGSGKIHISYYDYLNKDLKYTTNGSGSWQATILDSVGIVGLYTSLRVDPFGRVHISYLDSTNLDLKYATNVSGGWLLTTVDTAGYVGPHTSLALDGSGQVHIGYFDSTNGDLKYAQITNDLDADGVLNAADNCPSIANTDQANFDSDSLGDVCDEDDDNDGLPDSNEIALGLNPLNSADASFDLDADGYANLREYLSGSALNNPHNRLSFSDLGPESKLLPAGTVLHDSFGSAVAAYGDYLAVADGYNSTETLYVFQNQSGSWVSQQLLDATDGLAYDGLSEGLAMEGTTIVGGARWNDESGNNAGAVVVFGYDGSNWSEQAKIKPADISAEDRFGWSVAISGDRLVASSNYDDDKGENSGSVYIFRRSGTTWVQEAKLTASDGAAYDYFGQAVAIEGNQIFVGASFDSDLGPSSGSVYVFRNDGSGWQQVQKIHASDGVASDYFGHSLSVSGNRLAVGAFADDDRGSNSGAVYFFTYNGTIWEQVTKLTASDGVADDAFGNMLDLRNDTLLVGVSRNDNAKGTNAGGAYLFNYTEGSWVEHKLVASDGKAESNYGQYVTLADGYAMIGAMNDDNNTINSGAVYIYPLNYTLFTDADADADSIFDASDNCPAIANTDQANFDGDALGDVCDIDDDNDGILDTSEIANNTDPLNSDITAPAVTFTSTLSGLTNQNSTILTYSANESATFSLTRNGAVVTVASGTSLTLVEGLNTLSATATDAAGNKTTATVTVTRDTIIPITTASVLGGTYTTTKTVTLTANESATIYYTVNGATPTTASSAYNSPLNITASTTLKYFARDAAGNSEGVKNQNYTITLSTTPPAPGSSFNVIDSLSGGVVTLNWPSYDPGTTTVAAYQLYTSDRPFTTISGMTPAQSYTPSTTTGAITGLADNVPVYVALVPVNAGGQFDANIAPVAVTPTRQGVSGYVKAWIYNTPLNHIMVTSGSYSTYTDLDGFFRLTGLPVGSVTLSVGEEGGDLRYVGTSTAVTVTAGQISSIPTIKLTPKVHNLAPATPANCTVTAGDGKVTLIWTPNTDADLAGYYIYRDGVALNTTPVKDPFYIDQTVINGTTYTYTVKAKSATNIYSPATEESIVTPMAMTRPPVDLSATLNCDGTVTLSWMAPPSSVLDGYNLYQQTGSTMSYGSFDYLLGGNTTTWTSDPLPAGQTYTFAVRSVGSLGEESNTTVKTTLSVPTNWNAPQASITIPKAGKRVDGNALHLQAEPATIGCGTASTSNVRFQYRPTETADWLDVPAALAQHPNPATSAPYFTKWDVTALDEGDYDLRSVAANSSSTDSGAGFITVTIDHHQPQIAENRSADNIPQSQGEVEKESANVVTTGLGSALFPTGSLSSDAILTIASLPLEVQPTGSSSLLATPVDLTLSSGQTTFPSGSEIELALSYSDSNNDGIIDGQGFFAQDTEAATFNQTSGLWEPLTDTTLDTVKKQVKGKTSHFSIFGLSRKPNLPIAAKSVGIYAPTINTNGSYQVSWNIASGAGNVYELQQASDTGFTQNVTTLYTGTNNYSSLNNQPNGSYYYRVRTVRPGHQPSEWKAVASAVNVDLTCDNIAGIYTPATNSNGSYQISWNGISTLGVTYVLTENDSEIYSGNKNYFNVTDKGANTYNYKVKAIKNGYKESAVKGPVTTSVVLAVGSIAGIYTPTTNTSGSYQISWNASSTPGVEYILTENGIQIYKGKNNYYNVTGRANNTYAYRVKATKLDHIDSAEKGPVNTIVTLAVGSIAGIYTPTTNTSGSYQISWNASSTSGVEYILTENGIQIYKGTNNYYSVTGRANNTYAYRVKATKLNHIDSAEKGPVNTIVTLTVGSIAGIYAPTTNTSGSYQISWNASSTPGVEYILTENGIQIYKGTNNYYNVTGRASNTYAYRVKATKLDHIDSAEKGPITVTVNR